MNKKALVLALLVIGGLFYLFTMGGSLFQKGAETNQGGETTETPGIIVSGVDLAKSSVEFIDFLTHSKLNVAAVYCSSRSECSSAEEGNAGGVSWRVLANSVLYGMNPSSERKAMLDGDFDILGNLEPSLPIVTGFGINEAYRLTKERKFGGYIFLLASKISAELAARPQLVSYGAMLDGMVGKELIDAYAVINDPKYGEYLAESGLSAANYADTSKRFLEQAVRIKALLATSAEPSKQYFDAQTSEGDRQMNAEWIIARCWYSLVSAGLFQVTNDPIHAEDVSNILSGIRSNSKDEIARNGAVSSLYAPCVDAAQTLASSVEKLKTEGKDVSALPQPFIMREIADLLIQTAILPSFDTPYRPLCDGSGAVLGGWNGANSEQKDEACRSAARSIADTGYSILLLSRSTGKFKL